MAKNFGTTWWGNRWLQSLLKNMVEHRAAKDLSITPPQFQRVNFSRLTDRLEVLLMLLPQNPTFEDNAWWL